MRISWFWAILLPLTIFITYLADATVGHGALLWLFTIVILVLLHSITWGRISWFYVFTTVFLILGCWVKVVFHHIFSYQYIEPIGDFSGTHQQWFEYYLTAIAFALALIFAKGCSLLFQGYRQKVSRYRTTGVSVNSYVWVGLVFWSVVIYAFNNSFDIFVTGVTPKLTLPLSLNAPLAFFIFIGFAIVASVFVSRDVFFKKRLDSRTLAVFLFVSVIASVSMASRAVIVMQVLPVLLSAIYVQKTFGVYPIRGRVFFLFAVAVVSVLTAVSLYRIVYYLGGSIFDVDLWYYYAMESASLFVDRWVGAEAIMVSVSEPSASLGLMWNLLVEDPKRGVEAIFQISSGSKYGDVDGNIFLTLPGYFGVLGLSGSNLVVFLGTWIVIWFFIAYEKFLRWATSGSTICVALMAAAISNALTQISFPKLFFIFVLLMTFFAIMLHNIFFRRQLLKGPKKLWERT